jgi:hypothetical protein
MWKPVGILLKKLCGKAITKAAVAVGAPLLDGPLPIGDIIAVVTKSRPYAACAINELKFSATNIVKYGSNDKTNKDNAVNQMTS